MGSKPETKVSKNNQIKQQILRTKYFVICKNCLFFCFKNIFIFFKIIFYFLKYLYVLILKTNLKNKKVYFNIFINNYF